MSSELQNVNLRFVFDETEPIYDDNAIEDFIYGRSNYLTYKDSTVNLYRDDDNIYYILIDKAKTFIGNPDQISMTVSKKDVYNMLGYDTQSESPSTSKDLEELNNLGDEDAEDNDIDSVSDSDIETYNESKTSNASEVSKPSGASKSKAVHYSSKKLNMDDLDLPDCID